MYGLLFFFTANKMKIFPLLREFSWNFQNEKKVEKYFAIWKRQVKFFIHKQYMQLNLIFYVFKYI
jgi:hypothetical protein